MEKVYIGKIVSTHGIKGEVRILSDFPYKEKVFFKNNILMIEDKEYIIKTYRYHKIYDMVTLNDYKDINEVLFLIGKSVYVARESLSFNDGEILDSDLVQFDVFCDGKKGHIIELFKASETNKIVRFEVDGKKGLFPLNNQNIRINKSEMRIYIKKEDVVFDEN